MTDDLKLGAKVRVLRSSLYAGDYRDEVLTVVGLQLTAAGSVTVQVSEDWPRAGCSDGWSVEDLVPVIEPDHRQGSLRASQQSPVQRPEPVGADQHAAPNAPAASDPEPPYYAEGGKVWKRPVHTKNPDGSTSISIGFPVCIMHEAVGADAAETVSALMSLGDQHSVQAARIAELEKLLADAEREAQNLDRDARLWRGLTAMARMSWMGHAGFAFKDRPADARGYRHITINFWTLHRPVGDEQLDSDAAAQTRDCAAKLVEIADISARLAGEPSADTRDARQRTVSTWAAAAFGIDQATSLPQRGIRLLEEAVEAAQAAGTPRDKARALVDFVYDRPAGELRQELGGVGVCALALAAAAGLSADDCEAAEVARVLAKPLDHFAARNAAKNAAGFDTTTEAAGG